MMKTDEIIIGQPILERERCSLEPYDAPKGKRWYCIRHSKELTNEESLECRGCESLSLTILKEINE